MEDLAPHLTVYLAAHPPRLVRDLSWQLLSEGDRAEAAERLCVRFSLGCGCGTTRVRVVGVPAVVATGRGGRFLQIVLRGFREVRAVPAGAPPRPIFQPPVAMVCSRCGRESELLPGSPSQSGGRMRRPVREALRCRACGVSTFELAVGFGFFAAGLDLDRLVGLEERYDDLAIEARCTGCGLLLPVAQLAVRSERVAKLARLHPHRDSGAC